MYSVSFKCYFARTNYSNLSNPRVTLRDYVRCPLTRKKKKSSIVNENSSKKVFNPSLQTTGIDVWRTSNVICFLYVGFSVVSVFPSLMGTHKTGLSIRSIYWCVTPSCLPFADSESNMRRWVLDLQVTVPTTILHRGSVWRRRKKRGSCV